MKRLFLGLIFYFLIIQTFSQSWEGVGGGVNNSVYCLFADTINNLLYSGGWFTQAGGVNASEIAVWDGIYWDSLGAGAGNCSPVWNIINYHDTIYASAGCFFYPYNDENYIAKWNGTKWDSLGSGINDAATALTIYNDTLYVGGTFNNAGGIYTTLIAKYDGAKWHSFPFHFDNGGSSIYGIVFYQGKMYMGGNYTDTVDFSLHDFTSWDGTTLSPPPSGFPLGAIGVYSMCIYHGDLYLAGEFNENILRFDGTNFYDVGGGTDYGILNMIVYNDELYVVGGFNNAGGQPASKIAKWNGNTWSALSNDVFDNNLSALAFLNGELYVGGGFHTINGDNINYIAKYTGVLGTKENIQSSFNVNLYPNPANENLHLAISSKQNEGELQIEISDMLGETVAIFKEENFTGTYNKQISIANLSSGVYFIKMQGKEGLAVRKFVKE